MTVTGSSEMPAFSACEPETCCSWIGSRKSAPPSAA